MNCKTFAEGNGFFHKGSGGTGTAPIDVCLSPPPPPTGPVPVPYVNTCSASDLSNGSKSVLFDGGNPTAMENVSEVSTSSGDEGGTQGGGVVTHKTKGTASFLLWSFVVKVEGKGACCHSHPMFQNGMSTPKNIVCARSKVIRDTLSTHGFDEKYDCTECEKNKFKRRDPTTAQQTRADEIGNRGGNQGGCWSCKRKRNQGTFGNGAKWNRGKSWTPDHQPPQDYVWLKLGGCKGACDPPPADEAARQKFNNWADDPNCIRPQCAKCSASQGGSCGGANGEAAMNKLMSAIGAV